MMNAEEKEQLRFSLLRFLDANPTRFGLTVPLLLQMARNEGRPGLAREQVEAELQYLEDKHLVAEVLKGISPENRAWRISAEGRDCVAARM